MFLFCSRSQAAPYIPLEHVKLLVYVAPGPLLALWGYGRNPHG